MIVKSCEMTNALKSSMKRLVNYLISTQGKDERLEYIWSTNCMDNLEAHINETVTAQVLDDVKTRIDWNVEDMSNVQARNTRTTKDKTYHLVISFREGERKLTLDDLKKIENELLKGLGYEDRQRICIAHRDTDNVHFHIALNKIHPTTYNTHNPYRDFEKLQKVAEKLEQEYGFLPDNHKTKQSVSDNKIKNIGLASDMQSFAGWLQNNCSEQLNKAATWDEVHNVLSQHSVEIIKKGAGLVFKDKNSDIAVKASSVSREFSFKKLETRFGEYQEAPQILQKPEKSYEKKPVGQTETNSGRNLWKDFKEAEKNRKQTMNDELEQVFSAYCSKVDEIKDNADKTFKLIKESMVAGNTNTSKEELYARRKALREDVYARRNALITEEKTKYQNYKTAIFEQNKPVKWLSWLTEKAQQGDDDALAYLSKRMFPSQINAMLEQIQGQEGAEQSYLNERQGKTITKKGTVFHSKNVKETQDMITLSNASFAERQKSLNLAIYKFGSSLTLCGSREFQENMVKAAVYGNIDCTFTNTEMELYRQALVAEREKTYKPQNIVKAAPKEKIYIDVPYKESMQARSVGARWDNVVKSWYVMEGIDSEKIKQWPTKEPNLPTDQTVIPVEPNVQELDSQKTAYIKAYIQDRNKLIGTVKDLTKHVLCGNQHDVFTGEYAGIRSKNGSHMALVKQEQQTVVIPLNSEDAAHKLAKTFKIGDQIAVENGNIKKLQKQKTHDQSRKGISR